MNGRSKSRTPPTLDEGQMCEGPCEGEYPAFCFVYDPPLADGAEPAPGQQKAYCRSCAAFRMSLDVFPTPLEDIPIRKIEDPYA